MQLDLSSWQFWALLSALFAALTSILAKVGVESIDSDLATFIRTVVAKLIQCCGKQCRKARISDALESREAPFQHRFEILCLDMMVGKIVAVEYFPEVQVTPLPVVRDMQAASRR